MCKRQLCGHVQQVLQVDIAKGVPGQPLDSASATAPLPTLTAVPATARSPDCRAVIWTAGRAAKASDWTVGRAAASRAAYGVAADACSTRRVNSMLPSSTVSKPCKPAVRPRTVSETAWLLGRFGRRTRACGVPSFVHVVPAGALRGRVGGRARGERRRPGAMTI
jgi:hypothetical protein